MCHLQRNPVEVGAENTFSTPRSGGKRATCTCSADRKKGEGEGEQREEEGVNAERVTQRNTLGMVIEQ